jgi:hypothetical protein
MDEEVIPILRVTNAAAAVSSAGIHPGVGTPLRTRPSGLCVGGAWPDAVISF